MQKPAKPDVFIPDFLGMMTNVDQRDIATGAAEVQVNLQCVRIGELSTRSGLREVTFEDD